MALRVLVLLLVLLIAPGCRGCSRRGAATTGADAGASPASTLHTEGPIVWTMKANAPQVTRQNRDSFRIEITAYNHGKETLNTHRNLLNVRMNGQPSGPFRLRWNQGAPDAKWSALGPGESVTEKRELTDFIYALPGDYNLELFHGSLLVARLRVTVAK